MGILSRTKRQEREKLGLTAPPVPGLDSPAKEPAEIPSPLTHTGTVLARREPKRVVVVTSTMMQDGTVRSYTSEPGRFQPRADAQVPKQARPLNIKNLIGVANKELENIDTSMFSLGDEIKDPRPEGR